MVKLEVTLDIFSGNPNPRWEMPEDKVKEFFEMKGWKELMIPEDSNYLNLGYKGFIINVLSDEEEKIDLNSDEIPKPKNINLPSSFRIYGSKKVLEDESNTNFKHSLDIKEIQEKEKWLLNTAGADLFKTRDEDMIGKPNVTLSQELYKYVEDSISGSNSNFADSESQQQEIQQDSKDALATCNLRATYYNPPFWNDQSYLRYNNCYNYAMGKRTNTFAQPGRAHGCSFNMDCTSVANAAKCDKVITNCQGNNPYYYVALVIWPNNDYHWYHWHMERFWGHKPGQTAARNTDNSNHVITGSLYPHNCDRGPYTVFCGYYYGPTNTTIN
jgi:hypothetical protein